ncbi:hypothetical protein P43SY_003992 [Pythium insidiosum]|uniref:Uncharacterized protein n=1 Tax=Pythium insidiosum TaxID=114742 RepID=A0AAD5Q842_PYTIN|nr:hypothetical protein P43SY_003992 [Pythium insidiosum]
MAPPPPRLHATPKTPLPSSPPLLLLLVLLLTLGSSCCRAAERGGALACVALNSPSDSCDIQGVCNSCVHTAGCVFDVLAHQCVPTPGDRPLYESSSHPLLNRSHIKYCDDQDPICVGCDASSNKSLCEGTGGCVCPSFCATMRAVQSRCYEEQRSPMQVVMPVFIGLLIPILFCCQGRRCRKGCRLRRHRDVIQRPRASNVSSVAGTPRPRTSELSLESWRQHREQLKVELQDVELHGCYVATADGCVFDVMARQCVATPGNRPLYESSSNPLLNRSRIAYCNERDPECVGCAVTSSKPLCEGTGGCICPSLCSVMRPLQSTCYEERRTSKLYFTLVVIGVMLPLLFCLHGRCCCSRCSFRRQRASTDDRQRPRATELALRLESWRQHREQHKVELPDVALRSCHVSVADTGAYVSLRDAAPSSSPPPSSSSSSSSCV